MEDDPSGKSILNENEQIRYGKKDNEIIIESEHTYKKGKKFESFNDTEVAAGYISNQLSKNNSMKKTLTKCLSNLDGFYTFIAGTNNGFAVLRDEIACKPAVIAENKDYVAVASEFQAMAHLPNVNNANIYEPEPGVVYTWGN